MAMNKEQPFTIRSEFGFVRIEKDTSALGERLKITDLRTGKANYLDPLELECLAWAEHDALKPLLNPSLTRWAIQP